VKQNAIQPANLEFNAEGTPVSRDFDDVYFSNDNGLEETAMFSSAETAPERFPDIPARCLSSRKAASAPVSIS
jgi:tRNA 5-methylaminomethyl-2-thiouridine biosynthesis bifunctional protein